MRQNQILFSWDETEPDFIFMKWDKTGNFFVKWDRTGFVFSEMKQNQILFSWDETESDFIFIKWNRIENFFMRWNKTKNESSLNKMKLNLHETECFILIL